MQVSEQIIQVLDALAQKLGMAIDWTSANVIPYIEQLCGKYIRYEVVTSIVWIVFALILCVPIIYLFKQLSKHKDWGVIHYDYIDDDYILRMFIYMGAIILCLIPITMLMVQTFDIVTCLTFPEKIIINELQYLLN